MIRAVSFCWKRGWQASRVSVDGAISPRQTLWNSHQTFQAESLVWFTNVAICFECNQLRSFHEVYFKSRYVLYHLCRWVSHHLLSIEHVFVPPNFVAQKTTLFPFHQCFPPRSVSLPTTGSFSTEPWLREQGYALEKEISPWCSPLSLGDLTNLSPKMVRRAI